MKIFQKSGIISKLYIKGTLRDRYSEQDIKSKKGEMKTGPDFVRTIGQSIGKDVHPVYAL
jgi:hypothetical protein